MDTKFILFMVALTLLGGGGTLATLPFPDLWRTGGKIAAAVGFVIGLVAAFVPL